MRIISLLFTLFLLVSCATTGSRTISSEAFPSRIIDAHTHFHAYEGEVWNQPSEKMLKDFEEAGVVAAVTHLSGKEEKVVVNRNAKVKFAVCASLSPGQTVAKVEKGLKEGRYQCMKVYLGYVPLWAMDKYYQQFYKLAEKYKVPVVFHTGDTYDKMAKVKYAEPLQIDEVAVTYPKVNFVIAHMGNPWFDSAAEVVYKNDNVYCDTSALMLDDVSKQNPESVEELIVKKVRWFWLFVENPKKLMFASDYPLLKITSYRDAIKRAIPPEHWQAVFYDNAARVFNLKEEAK